MIQWFIAHWTVVATVLLGVSESLAILFPAQAGFGGILAGLIKFLKGAGVKEPGQA